MGKYVVRRLLQMVPVVIGATFILFALVFALPGDPTAGRCGERPCPPSYVAAFRAEFRHVCHETNTCNFEPWYVPEGAAEVNLVRAWQKISKLVAAESARERRN